MKHPDYLNNRRAPDSQPSLVVSAGPQLATTCSEPTGGPSRFVGFGRFAVSALPLPGTKFHTPWANDMTGPATPMA